MSETSNQASSPIRLTADTVSETPSRVTEPSLGKEAGEVRRDRDTEDPAVADLADFGHRAEAIDVTVNEVAAEFVAELEREFEVDEGVDLPLPDSGAGQRFRDGLDIPPRALVVRPEIDDRETDAGMLDRSAELEVLRTVVTAADGDTAQAVALLDQGDAADIGDKSGEHSNILRPVQRPCAKAATPVRAV